MHCRTPHTLMFDEISMKYLVVLTLTTLSLSVGCQKRDVGQSPGGNGTSPISNSEQASVDGAKEHELVVRPSTPIPQGGESPELHVRYSLTARHGGKLLVRVREPLLATLWPNLFALTAIYHITR